jgi:hypothetical protein
MEQNAWKANTQLVKKFYACRTQTFIALSQDTTTGPYTEPDESSPPFPPCFS